MENRRKKTAAPAADENAPAAGTLVDARTAIERLGIKMQTLYAYVSRGWVRVVPAVGGKGNLYYVCLLYTSRVGVEPEFGAVGQRDATPFAHGRLIPVSYTHLSPVAVRRPSW